LLPAITGTDPFGVDQRRNDVLFSGTLLSDAFNQGLAN
jgi:hypothetical protein